MARQVITVLTDDLDGTDADRTVEFGFDGVTYSIDLSEKNVAKIRKALEPFVAAAARAPRRSSAPASRTSSRGDNKAIRAWAGKNGWAVSDRGRIPSAVVEAYQER